MAAHGNAFRRFGLLRASTATTLVIGLLAVAACGGDSGKSSAKKPKPGGNGDTNTGRDGGSGDNQVVLEALGDGKADVAYNFGPDVQDQENDLSLPWKRTRRFETVPTPLTMMVVAKKGEGLACRITVNDKIISYNKSRPGENILTCRSDDAAPSASG